MKYYLIFGIAIIFLMSACTQHGTNEKTTLIGDIIAHPEQYDGKTVIIDGRFGGWSGGLPCNYKEMAMKTRSDTIIYDKTGCLYMNGYVKILYKEKGLDPTLQSNVGGRIKIKARVSLLNGKPILEGPY